ncbi:hypothetical protein [Bradyrhizobium sp. NBAIM02]|uniref:hypothetical protein n=1 Tax=Bradyrhizobium sp. NBAIM02 TaxID=2793817 RepID=UPI001CD2B02F|nr:hypothetical protein [Bradyrhizobium sp. NBAIM02]MCA1503808.1 hypothetical protein [Bradyrhizobium sp. NBAIM02]
MPHNPSVEPRRAGRPANSRNKPLPLQHVRLIDRAALRLEEFSALVGLSKVTLWRRVRAGHLNVVYLGTVPLITRVEMQRLGLIAPDGADK